ncbi:dihydroxyacetone kinase subunit DhaK [Patulibacter sp. SYSU D01012]|uniref:dihydroxyacetone kinase subunit DhaK n=1 Tax=Patulibacter sp. SYSU D01012 TaxID=2817381 RepID=UPI001FEF966E|nr:dihydroxyacetone kinase subunit DhaK [Patulibacter sp. SYSU D01012]
MTAATQADLLLRALAQTAREDVVELDRLDAVTGDGDFGSTLGRGVRALAADPPSGTVAAVLRAASERMSAAMGGSSGAFVGIGLLRAARALHDAGEDDLTAAQIAAAVRAAVDGVTDLGGARPGDKTFLDALAPLADALDAGQDPVAAAADGAASTREMTARVGRSSYAGERSKGEPDAGATAVAATVRRLQDADDVPAWDALRGGPDATQDEDDAAPTDGGFVNDPHDLVDEALDGLVSAHAETLAWLDGHRAVVRRDGPAGDRVAIVSGGGAGHEPLHASFVGPGMLDAACPGAVFTSPSSAQIAAAAHAVAGEGGVLFVVKQYTGDVLNFRLAAELLADDGIRSATVIVADDVALDADAAVGRRGTGATVAVERIAGAAAAAGRPLEDVRALAQRVADAGRSFGVALHGDEMELGVGIHGEPGRPREPRVPADEIARQLVAPLLPELPAATEAPLLLQVSGLGGTPPLELHVLLRGVLATLRDDHGLTPARILTGDLVTSLDQAGAIVTLVPLDDETLAFWDAPLRTPALRWG